MKECHKKHDNIQKFEPGALGSTFILKHHSNFPYLSWDSHAYTNLVYVLLSFPITRYNVCDRKKISENTPGKLLEIFKNNSSLKVTSLKPAPRF